MSSTAKRVKPFESILSVIIVVVLLFIGVGVYFRHLGGDIGRFGIELADDPEAVAGIERMMGLFLPAPMPIE